MKEVTIVQKAERYDEALKVIKDNLDALNLITKTGAKIVNIQAIKNCFYRAFPELKEESEGEIIRKSIICGMNALKKQNKETFANIPIDDCVAWLEEQCEQKPYGQREECEDCQFNYAGECKGYCQMKIDEQKPTDKVEPKFKVGDTIRLKNSNVEHIIEGVSDNHYYGKGFFISIFGGNRDYELVEQNLADKVEPKFKVGDWIIQNEWKNITKIVNATPLVYEVVDVLGYHNTITDTAIENNYHLWTIQDVKNGDVLALNDEVFIYANRKELYSIAVAHCFVDSAGGFHFDGEFGYTEKGNSIQPATKEQRDTLMKSMANADYTFDFEKKELKKIEEPKNFKNQVMSEITDLVEDYITKEHNEWSEEDETSLTNTIIMLKEGASLHFRKNDIKKAVDWLKSLKPQNNWKPSEEQMKVLDSVRHNNTFDVRILDSLFHDLENL